MGFAVVADEVRNLAHRSAQAAQDTADKIQDSVMTSGRAVRISTKVAVSLHEIVAKTRLVHDLIAEVAAASKEQTLGITQISGAVSQIERVIHSNAEEARNTSGAVDEMSSEVSVLQSAVQRLSELVGTEP